MYLELINLGAIIDFLRGIEVEEDSIEMYSKSYSLPRLPSGDYTAIGRLFLRGELFKRIYTLDDDVTDVTIE